MKNLVIKEVEKSDAEEFEVLNFELLMSNKKTTADLSKYTGKNFCSYHDFDEWFRMYQRHREDTNDFNESIIYTIYLEEEKYKKLLASVEFDIDGYNSNKYNLNVSLDLGFAKEVRENLLQIIDVIVNKSKELNLDYITFYLDPKYESILENLDKNKAKYVASFSDKGFKLTLINKEVHNSMNIGRGTYKYALSDNLFINNSSNIYDNYMDAISNEYNEDKLFMYLYVYEDNNLIETVKVAKQTYLELTGQKVIKKENV